MIIMHKLFFEVSWKDNLQLAGAWGHMTIYKLSTGPFTSDFI